MRDDEMLRERLAQALFHAEDAAGDWSYFGDDFKRSYRDAADRLLPFVVGNMRRYAALHLRDAATDLASAPGNPYPLVVSEFLNGRADELDPPTPTVRRRPDDEARTATQAKEGR